MHDANCATWSTIEGVMMKWSHLHGSEAAHKVDVDNLVHAEVHKVPGDEALLALVCMLCEEDVTCCRLQMREDAAEASRCM